MYNLKNLNIWKQQETKEAGLRGLREIDITEMNLSVRSYNCLRRAGCNTVGDILDLMDEDGNGLRKIRNLGSRSEAEIREMLKSIEKEYRDRPDPVSGDTSGRRPAGSGQNDPGCGRGAEQPGKPQRLVKPAKQTMAKSIDEYHLSHRTRSQLKASGIYHVGDLYEEGREEEPGWFAVRELFEQILKT